MNLNIKHKLFMFVLISFILLPTSKQVYAANHFINVTTPDFYSIWANGTNLLENQFLLNDTYYNGTYTGLIYNSDSEGIPTGETQTDDVTFFVQAADFGTFWTHKELSNYKIRYSSSPFITGSSDQDGLFFGLFLDNPYAVLGPYGDQAISVTTLRTGLFLGGWTALIAPLAYIAAKKPNAGVVVKCAMVMIFGFALILAIVDTI